MASYNYSTRIGENEASAVGRGLPISTKHAIEACAFVRGKKLETAKSLLAGAVEESTPVPFRRFTDGVGHKKGSLAAGRFAKKACAEILKVVNSAQANAQFKGLSSVGMVLRHISAQRDANTPKYGRRRAFTKRTTIEVVLAEAGKKKAGKEEKKVVEKKEEPKKEPVKEKQKEEPKNKEPKGKEAVKEEKAAEKKEKPEPEAEEKPVPKKEEPAKGKKEAPEPEKPGQKPTETQAKKQEEEKAGQ